MISWCQKNGSTLTFMRLITYIGLISGSLLLSACALPSLEQTERERINALFDPLNGLALARTDTALATQNHGSIETVARRAARYHQQTLADFEAAEKISIRQIPFLFSSAEGQSYLVSEGPKAMVQGTPAHQCPVRAQIRQEAKTNSTFPIARLALERCHADLEALGLAENCGCELLLVNDVLMAPLEQFSYATDLPARIFENGTLRPEWFFVREIFTGDSTRGLDILGPKGSYAQLDSVAAGPVAGSLADGTSVRGTFEISGLARGRKNGVLSLERQDGSVIRVIMGL